MPNLSSSHIDRSGFIYAAHYGSLQAAVDAAFLEAPARRSTGRVYT